MSNSRRRSATRRAAAELAAHRRRLLEVACDPELDPTDAILLRVAPTPRADYPPNRPADFPVPPLSTSSRGPVIGVTSHADKGPKDPQSPQDLTGTPAHNVPRSAECAAHATAPDSSPIPDAAHSADLPAIPDSQSRATAPVITAPAPSLTPTERPTATAPSPLPPSPTTGAGRWGMGRRLLENETDTPTSRHDSRAGGSGGDAASPATPSRAAVTGVTSHAGQGPQTPSKHARTREVGREISGDDERGRPGAEDMRLMASGLTADPAHNLPSSAGQAQACHADIPASKDPLCLATVPGPTAPDSGNTTPALENERPAEAGRSQNPWEVGGTDAPGIAPRIIAPPEGIEPSLPKVRSRGPASTGGGYHRSRGSRRVASAPEGPADFPVPPLAHPSRAAVIGVMSHADTSPKGDVTPSEASGLTADRTHNLPSSAGQAQACQADIPASNHAPSLTPTEEPAATAPSPLSPSPTTGAGRWGMGERLLKSETDTPTSRPGRQAGGTGRDAPSPATELQRAPSAPASAHQTQLQAFPAVSSHAVSHRRPRRVGASGVGTASPAADRVSDAPASMSSPKQSGRSGGFPAGVTTQGEHT